jgi:hypothetical protein
MAEISRNFANLLYEFTEDVVQERSKIIARILPPEDRLFIEMFLDGSHLINLDRGTGNGYIDTLIRGVLSHERAASGMNRGYSLARPLNLTGFTLRHPQSQPNHPNLNAEVIQPEGERALYIFKNIPVSGQQATERVLITSPDEKDILKWFILTLPAVIENYRDMQRIKNPATLAMTVTNLSRAN